jgi:uncharacterized membrane protein YedE/YeeE
MSAPFFKFGLFGENMSLVLAFVIGIGFGFFLERAGFGNGRKLAAQFYFTDMAVVKVMFSAIVTAMIGLFYLGWIGWLDLSLVNMSATFIVPQVIGGLILGVGFVIGGYCPGTSVVAMSTGRIDAMVYLAGILVGVFGFGELFPILGDFYRSTALGQITLPQFFDLPYGLIVFVVILMAIGMFTAAEWGEKKAGGKRVEAK